MVCCKLAVSLLLSSLIVLQNVRATYWWDIAPSPFVGLDYRQSTTLTSFPTAQTSPTTSSTTVKSRACFCVMFYQCDPETMTMNEYGTDIIDFRQGPSKKGKCPVGEICCYLA